ncbi:pyridoxamine 5'-phosphate oxidase family protein [Sinosporangium siamense]|uniref:Oxidoreductase n=1 Tax=Sinosporangium siamense TaxID=1367973 RepID=A0A919RLB9_9ACTN|nr:pyridoxamine 5'-phosphate oxidase family protein [Sinosporangium siamense]GII94514.1 oxidoreductase [Sinosporangium siamense]
MHPGELAVQRRAGVRAEGYGSAGVNASIPPPAAEFLRLQRMLVVGAAGDDGRVWVTVLSGQAGFAEPENERVIVVDALPGEGDPLYGLLDHDRDVGILAIEPQTRRRMRVNGRARMVGGKTVVTTDQVYANCPKYITTRRPAPDGPAGRGPARTTAGLDRAQRGWIERADTFFVATYARGQGADVSHRGGNPGFVSVTGPNQLVWPDYAGNSMYMTLGNLALDARAGLFFLDWEAGTALHLTGRARTDWEPRGVAGAQRLVEFEIDRVVQIEGAVPLRWSLDRYSRFNPQE